MLIKRNCLRITEAQGTFNPNPNSLFPAGVYPAERFGLQSRHRLWNGPHTHIQYTYINLGLTPRRGYTYIVCVCVCAYTAHT